MRLLEVFVFSLAAALLLPIANVHADESTARPTPAEAGDAAEAETSLAAPASARVALDRAAAAYESGDINLMIESLRPVVDGLLPASPGEHADALKLLGIGLYLTNRTEGAHKAFVELLTLRPESLLNPTTTRPEVVAFFHGILRERREQEQQRRRREKSYVWAFLPPVGQVLNGDSTRAWIVGGLEVLALGTAATSAALYYSDKGDYYVHEHSGRARAAQTIFPIAAGVFAATYVYGVIDAVLHHDHLPDDDAAIARRGVPRGPALRFAAGPQSVQCRISF